MMMHGNFNDVRGGRWWFVGLNFVLDWVAENNRPVVNLDKLTYAGNLEKLASLEINRGHIFVPDLAAEKRTP